MRAEPSHDFFGNRVVVPNWKLEHASTSDRCGRVPGDVLERLNLAKQIAG